MTQQVSDQPIDLSGLTIITLDDKREPVVGSYTPTTLAELFVSYWIPYLECQECGRHTYCKFTKPHPYPAPRRAGRLAEIKCGVVESVIHNYVPAVFPLLDKMSRDELQSFLDGSYYLVKFVYEAELQIGSMLSGGFINWLGEAQYRAMFFGSTARLRRHLDRFAGEFRGIEAFRTKTTVILTEGASEKAFLEKLKESRLTWFTDLDVQAYFGKGGRGPKKLEVLAGRLHDQGYDIFVQGDRDGKVRDIFHQLVRRGIVPAANTFAFAVDFESSFPDAALYDALHAMEVVHNVELDDFRDKLSKRPEGESVLTTMNREWSIDVDKMELADTLGGLANDYLLFKADEQFWSSTEIGRFLDKIRRLP